jgi:hypothetical protein
MISCTSAVLRSGNNARKCPIANPRMMIATAFAVRHARRRESPSYPK